MSSNQQNTSVDTPEGWTRREMKGIPASLGALWTQKGENGWHYAIQLDETHANAQGFIHGGVMMSFIDHALSLLIWEATDRAMCTTVHLDSHFLSGVKPPAFLKLNAEIIKKGRNLVFARGALLLEDKTVMEANGVWSVVPRSPQ
ncbi:PaaI family thioesterase [Halioxenophilus sp. WMMB6]|uniref:PaaI family thioesterase n=1 Tax=Halioxenophilus sp. WMMB6 TaxID=3073815 RepID=UPI00295E3A34|nr:PaaI family thioesterase [Halioxenophilus sp. WMMB6]